MAQPLIHFFVPGIPATAGSKRVYVSQRNGKVSVVDDCARNFGWRQAVEIAADGAYKGEILRGPLILNVVFSFVRPASHYGTGRNAGKLKPSAPEYPAKKPDTTKLIRATEDALKGIIWADDGQNVTVRGSKVYSTRSGALVMIGRAQDPAPALCS